MRTCGTFFPRRHCISFGSGSFKFTYVFVRKFDAAATQRNTGSAWKKSARRAQFQKFWRCFCEYVDRIAVFCSRLCGRGRLITDTAHANRLKEHDSRPTRPNAAIAGSRKAATEERDTADSEWKISVIAYLWHFFSTLTLYLVG